MSAAAILAGETETIHQRRMLHRRGELTACISYTVSFKKYLLGAINMARWRRSTAATECQQQRSNSASNCTNTSTIEVAPTPAGGSMGTTTSNSRNPPHHSPIPSFLRLKKRQMKELRNPLQSRDVEKNTHPRAEPGSTASLGPRVRAEAAGSRGC